MKDLLALHRAAYCLIIMLAAVLRFGQLNQQCLTMDEVKDLATARGGWTSTQSAEDRFPPLYYLTLWAWMKACPWDETGRAFSAVCGILTVAVVGRLGRAVGDRTVELWTAATTAVAPFAVWYSVETRVYSLYLLFGAIALWQFSEAMKTGGWCRWATFAAASVAGEYTHYYFGLLVALAGVVFLAWRPRGRQWWVGMSAFAAIAVACIPVIWLLRADLDQPWGYAQTSHFSLGGLVYTYVSYLSGYTLGPSLRDLHAISGREAAMSIAPAALVLGTAAAVLSVLGWRATPRDERLRWLSWFVAFTLAPPALIGLVSQLAGFGYNIRHALWASSGLYVALGYGAAKGKPRSLAFAAAATLAGAFAVAHFNRIYSLDHRSEDSRAVASYLDQGDETRLPVFVSSGYMSEPLGWYTANRRKTIALPDARGEGGSIQEALALIDEHAPNGNFWFAYSRPFHGDPEGKLLVALEHAYQVKLTAEFAGYRLYRAGNR